MSFKYGELEDQIVDLCRGISPDFQKVDELIRRGADINAVAKDNPDDNILSDILYFFLFDEDYPRHGMDTQFGESMVKTVAYFLKNGFSVRKNNHRYGAKCLATFICTSFAEYMLTAVRLLLDAGARNAIVYSDENETTLNVIGGDISFQRVERDYHQANLLEACYQMILAVEEGKPYHGIDHYMKCYGK